MEKEINSLTPGFTFSVLHALPHSVYSHSYVEILKKKKNNQDLGKQPRVSLMCTEAIL